MAATQDNQVHSSSQVDLERLSEDFELWYKETFTPYVIGDYANVCLKVLHGMPSVSTLRPQGDEESPLSAQNRLRNVPRTYKRELRFKIISLYAQPFGLPWTQTFAQHMLRMVFGTTGSAVSLNSAFATSTRTSKDRVDFKPVLNSLNDSTISSLTALYDAACDELESTLLTQAMEKADRIAGKQHQLPGSISPRSIPQPKANSTGQNQISLF